MNPRRRNRKPTPRRPRYENAEHRRIRLGPGAGTHCTCGQPLVAVCKTVLNTMGLQMPPSAAARARQQSQAPIAARRQSQAAESERQAAKHRRLELLRRIAAPDPLEVARRTHAQIVAEELGLVVY